MPSERTTALRQRYATLEQAERATNDELEAVKKSHPETFFNESEDFLRLSGELRTQLTELLGGRVPMHIENDETLQDANSTLNRLVAHQRNFLVNLRSILAKKSG